MPYFAKCEPTANSVSFNVTAVISADEAFVETQPGLWKQTSYNTRGNVHYGPDGQPDGGIALRANYAGIGYTYDAVNDVFYAPAPYPDWILNTSTWLWEAPIPYPNDGKAYYWDDVTHQWVPVPTPPTE